jgi:hypothetical protein
MRMIRSDGIERPARARHFGPGLPPSRIRLDRAVPAARVRSKGIPGEYQAIRHGWGQAPESHAIATEEGRNFFGEPRTK